MAWTTPASYSVSEVVTASKLNTHIRDNLNYLKGAAGTVTIDAAMLISASGGNLLTLSGSATTTGIQITAPNVASQNAQISLTNSGQRNALIYMDRAADKLRISQNTTTNPAISIDASANVGIMNATTPQSYMHGYGGNGGFMFYENSATFSAAVTIIPNAAGDVLYRLVFFGVARCTNGPASAANLGTSITPGGGAADIASLNAAADILRMTVAADGSTTITRTAGTSTWAVSLVLMWA